jgi:hypothetical protein
VRNSEHKEAAAKLVSDLRVAADALEAQKDVVVALVFCGIIDCRVTQSIGFCGHAAYAIDGLERLKLRILQETQP